MRGESCAVRRCSIRNDQRPYRQFCAVNVPENRRARGPLGYIPIKVAGYHTFN